MHIDLFAQEQYDSFLSFFPVKFICTVDPLSQASPYPLILSLENHCSVEQQTVMARHLRSILRDKLLTKPLSNLDPHILPSPEVRRFCSVAR